MAAGYNEISGIREDMAILQAKFNDLCKAKDGPVERKPGRPKRLQQ